MARHVDHGASPFKGGLVGDVGAGELPFVEQLGGGLRSTQKSQVAVGTDNDGVGRDAQTVGFVVVAVERTEFHHRCLRLFARGRLLGFLRGISRLRPLRLGPGQEGVGGCCVGVFKRENPRNGVVALGEIATRWLWQQCLCRHTGRKHEGERCGSDEAFC